MTLERLGSEFYFEMGRGILKHIHLLHSRGHLTVTTKHLADAVLDEKVQQFDKVDKLTLAVDEFGVDLHIGREGRSRLFGAVRNVRL
jgi:hypothetical protein